MKKIDSLKTVTFMSKDNEPAAYIEAGEIITVDTLDCFSGEIISENQLLKDIPWDSVNPATGPIYINGAEKGDILKVSILDIQVDDRAVILCESEDIERYHFRTEEKSMFVNIVDGKAVISDRIQVKINPMIGVIGTAPESGKIPTTMPGTHGGNMDNTHISAGSVLYLPVFHDGALLSLGDLHALMGDGEATGSGLEISGKVSLKAEVLKNVFMPLPFIETDGLLETVASAESLDEAAILAVENMLTYLTENKGLDREEAWKLMAACGNTGICQFANALKTARCTVHVEE